MLRHPGDERSVHISFLLLSFSLLPSCALSVVRLTKRILLTATMPDEETPLLNGQQVAAVERSGPETPVLAGPSNESGRTLSVQGRADANGGSQSGVVANTPLPWARYSITLLLQVADHFTSQVIYPVSSSVGFYYNLLWRRFISVEGI